MCVWVLKIAAIYCVSCRLQQIYEELYHTINNADYEKDLKWWSNNHGVNMAMNWPQFEVKCVCVLCGFMHADNCVVFFFICMLCLGLYRGVQRYFQRQVQGVSAHRYYINPSEACRRWIACTLFYLRFYFFFVTHELLTLTTKKTTQQFCVK